MAYVEPDPKWIEKKEIELFETVCNPNQPENFVEALDNANEVAMKELGKLLKEGDAQKLGQFLLAFAEDYWCEASRQMAEDCWNLGDEAVIGRPV